MVVSNRNLLFQGSIFRGYVSFGDGNVLFCDTSLFVFEGAIDGNCRQVHLLLFPHPRAGGIGVSALLIKTQLFKVLETPGRDKMFEIGIPKNLQTSMHWKFGGVSQETYASQLDRKIKILRCI